MSKRVEYKRKREGKTNYKRRLTLLLSKKPRLVIRRSLHQIILQIIQYHEDGDKIIASANSSELKKLGWKLNTGNLPAAYLTGLLLGKKVKDKKPGTIIVDLGLNTPTKGAKIFAALKGAVDSGLDIPHSPDMFPSKEAIMGQKIQNYIENIKTKSNQFSQYKKNKINVEKEVEKIKNIIMKENERKKTD